MLLNEIFNKPTEYEWVNLSNSVAVAVFTVNNVEYAMTAYTDDEMGRHNWWIEFNIKNVPFTQAHSRTNKHNATAVLGTVVNILRDFVQRYNDKIEQVWFIPNDNNLLSIYRKMLNRFAVGWEVDDSTTLYDNTVIILRKTNLD